MTTREIIKAKELKIENLATELRCELEELAELVRDLWEVDEDYETPIGNPTTHDEVQDFADTINEIEQEFCNLDE